MTMFFNVFFINLLDKNNGTLYLQKIKKETFVSHILDCRYTPVCIKKIKRANLKRRSLLITFISMLKGRYFLTISL